VLPLFYKVLKKDWKWIQEFLFEILLSSFPSAVIASEIYI